MAMRLPSIDHFGNGGDDPETTTPGLTEALTRVRAATAACHAAGVSEHALLAAFMLEIIPRLVDTYGATGVALVLRELAAHIAGDAKAQHRPQ
ncbi:hypothetical protein [Arenibaculum pallidiluteum]|uniref:hypothetical protein n=1 Tax=Arenibaculum pallidiluteum TaxID=2812559 RepID=UPI001A9748BD|nr:hypothetical protein [Arenibaculum pallidiluteum]